MSLPRSERLRRGVEIQELFQQGNRDEKASFVTLWLPREGGRRIGFAVSRRVGGAVTRNRARRRLREAYRRQQQVLRAGVAAMFVARPGALTRRFSDLREEMRLTLETLNQGVDHARTARREPHR